MAPSFFSKLVKGSNTDAATTTTTTETTTKPTKRHSRDRSGSNKAESTKSGKSRQPSEDSFSPRTSFQFGISTLKSRSNSLSKNRAVSTPLAPENHAPSSFIQPTTHSKTASAPAEGLKVEKPKDGQRSRRNSIISAFGGGKNRGNSIVRQSDAPPQPQPIAVTNSSDSDIPRIAVDSSHSRDSWASSSTHLGVTVIPPSPLVYTQSLDSESVDFEHEGSQDQDAEQVDNSAPKPAVEQAPAVASPTTFEGTSSSVFNSLFQVGRRARTVSVSSAISGFIGELPNFVKGNAETPTDGTISTITSTVTTPTTATTIKANPFGLPREDCQDSVPPLPEAEDMSQPSKSNGSLAVNEVQRKTSTRSLNNIPPPLNLAPQQSNTLPRTNHSNHTRAATSPPDVSHTENSAGTVTMTPIVESPTGLKMPEYPNPPSTATTSGKDASKPAAPEKPQLVSSSNGGGSFSQLLSPRKVDDDAASIISTSSKLSPEKKRPWRRSTTRKPTGLAGAIAASGLAMANPGVSPVHAAATGSIMAAASSTSQGSSGSRRATSPQQPYLSKSPTRSAISSKSTTSPKSAKSSAAASRHTLHGPGSRHHHRKPSGSVISDGGASAGGHSEYFSGDSDGGRPKRGRRIGGGRSASRYQSGSETDTESETDSDSDDDSSDDDLLEGLDLGDNDMPVTGFAVASNKRNADFHELFPNVPEGDYLIEDYGCALQREILIQGRLYISENHVCFHANIFGWITDLSIPICEIISLEKKMTAFVIPNAIQITTRQSKYTFASFLSRDTTFDVIYNIWRVSRPDDVQSIRSGRGSLEGGVGNAASQTGVAIEAGAAASVTMNGSAAVGAKQVHKKTQCACGRDGKHYTETALDTVFPGSPEKIHNLMFASGFIKDFLATDQKLIDLQMSDWMPPEPGSKLLSRNMSYIKPLNASMGPKQTKCEIKDEIEHCDFDQYVSTITSTRTPDVPSGGVFTVKTRTCIMWASAISSRVVVTTQVDWSGRSFIKGIIERSAIDGQKVYHSELDRGMRSYIQEHKSEFVPEGMDTAAIEAVVAEPEKAEAAQADGERGITDVSEDQRNKQRERERNRRAFQWALDTVEGTWDVAKRSASGVGELIGDAWDQSSSTTILYFVIVILVISNLWTLVRMGKKEEIGRRKEMMKAEERERWVQSVVMTLWDELASGKKDPSLLRESLGRGPARLQPEPPRVEQLRDISLPPSLPSTTLSGSDAVPTAEPSPLLSWKEEVAQLQQTLALVEERVRTIRASIEELEKPNLDLPDLDQPNLDQLTLDQLD